MGAETHGALRRDRAVLTGRGRAGSRESFLEALKALLTEQKPAVTEGAAENTDGDRGWRVRLEE